MKFTLWVPPMKGFRISTKIGCATPTHLIDFDSAKVSLHWSAYKKVFPLEGFPLYGSIVTAVSERQDRCTTCTCMWIYIVIVHKLIILYMYVYMYVHMCLERCRVLPILVGSGRLQPPLSNFYHHSGLFYRHSQRVKVLKCYVWQYLSLTPLRLSWVESWRWCCKI